MKKYRLLMPSGGFLCREMVKIIKNTDKKSKKIFRDRCWYWCYNISHKDTLMSYFKYSLISCFKKEFNKERVKLLISKRFVHINVPPAIVYSVKIR